jgi:hypothetical protein
MLLIKAFVEAGNILASSVIYPYCGWCHPAEWLEKQAELWPVSKGKRRFDHE